MEIFDSVYTIIELALLCLVLGFSGSLGVVSAFLLVSVLFDGSNDGVIGH